MIKNDADGGLLTSTLYKFGFSSFSDKVKQQTNQKMDSAKRSHIEKAQNFMRQYRDPDSHEIVKLSANQFMEVWSHYDKDGKTFNPLFKLTKLRKFKKLIYGCVYGYIYI